MAEKQTPAPQNGTTATAGKTTRSNPWHYLTGRMAQEKGGKGLKFHSYPRNSGIFSFGKYFFPQTRIQFNR
jgi:hypothetical protein